MASGVVSVPGILSGSGQWDRNSVATAGVSDLGLSDALSIALWVKPSSLESVEARFLSKATGIENAEHYMMAGTIRRRCTAVSAQDRRRQWDNYNTDLGRWIVAGG